MKDKIIMQSAVILYKIPATRKLGERIIIRKLVTIVADGIVNFNKAIELRKDTKWKDNPYWDTATSLLAIGSLLPMAMIYHSLKSQQEDSE